MPVPTLESIAIEYQPVPPHEPIWSFHKAWEHLRDNFWVYLILVVLTILFAAPFYWLFVCSLSTQEQIFKLPPRVLPIPPVFENFRDVYQKTTLVRSFINSTVIAVCHVSLALLLCTLAGYAFAKFPKAPGNRWMFAFVLATMMIPGAVTMIPVFVI